jgi:DNA segregation ATPase FtsK/SpoIIIE-like protein
MSKRFAELASDPALLQIVALYLGRGEYGGCSFAQRKLGLRYNQTARYIETLEEAGVLSWPNIVGKRALLVTTVVEAKILIAAKAAAS